MVTLPYREKVGEDMNVRLLRKVQKHILAETKRFIMDDFVVRQAEGEETFFADDATEVPFAPCGTAACIAGWSVLLERGMRAKVKDFHAAGARVLGISTEYDEDHDLSSEATRLFYTCYWPHKFQTRYDSAKSQKQRAKVAVARIEHFIKTKGAE